MSRSYRQLADKMDPKIRAEAEQRARQELRRMALHDLRQARNYTQEQLAQVLKTKQAGVSRMEKSADMYVSTLRRFIEAMGGRLQIMATFPDGEFAIDQFQSVAEESSEEGVRSARD
jgi:transcriptional regulator with XRE-family HTH domain